MSQKIHRKTKSWYGLPVEINVSSNNLHLVKVAGLPLPHPGIVNVIARRGLPTQTRLELTAQHEFGHLQTLPLALLHLLLLLWPRQGEPYGSRRLRTLIILLTHQVFWEVVSESYVAFTDRRAFRAPRPTRTRQLYAVFGASMAVFSLLGTIFLIRNNKTV
jgi:hypothetical protein